MPSSASPRRSKRSPAPPEGENEASPSGGNGAGRARRGRDGRLRKGRARDLGAAKGDAGTPARLTATTPPPAKDVDKVTWATYREVGTLDPIQAFDYPENTIQTALCESLLRQQPDGTIEPGLAAQAEHPDDHTLVLKLRDGVKFWDGKPLTAA